MNCFKWKRRRAEASHKANPHLLCGLCRSNDGEDADAEPLLSRQQHSLFNTLDGDESRTNIDTQSTRDLDTDQHAEVTVPEVHQLDRDDATEADPIGLPETLESEKASTVKYFQQAYLKAGVDNFKVHEKYLEKLGDLYMKTYHQERECGKSPSWKILLKAFSLYNTAAAEEFNASRDDYWNMKTWAPVSCFLGDKSVADSDTFFASVKKLHEELQKIRAYTRSKMKIESPDSQKMIELILLSNNQMCDFAKMVIEESLKVMKEEPPCDFSTVGLGSIGRGEATPYSDLEYLFLIKDEGCTDFFEHLAVISYFLVGALRETSIHSIGITELTDWFIDKRRGGFQIDGITETSGNVPTGKESMPNVFINTPEKLIEVYSSVLDKPNQQESKRGDLTAMLTFTSLIHTNQNLPPESDECLHKQFVSAKDRINNKMNSKRVEANCEMLRSDLAKFRFNLEYSVYYSGFSLNLKRLLYRFPSLLLLDISIITNKCGDDSWETLKIWNQSDKDTDCGKVSSFSDMLFTLLLKGCYYRLKCYLAMNSRTDSFQIEPLTGKERILFVKDPSCDLFDCNRVVWNVAKQELYQLSADSITLQHHIHATGPHEASSIWKMIHNQVEPCAHATLLARFFCFDWITVVTELSEVSSPNSTAENSEKSSQETEKMPEVALAEAHSLLNCGKHQKALLALQRVLKNADRYDNKAVMTSIQGEAKCHFALGSLLEAACTYRKAIKRALENDDGIDRLNVGLVHLELGMLYSETNEYSLALEQFFKAMELLIQHLSIRKAGNCNALDDFITLDYVKRLKYVSNPSKSLVHCLYLTAGVFDTLKMADEASAYYNKAYSLGLLVVISQSEDHITRLTILHELGKMFTKPEYIRGPLDALEEIDDRLHYDALLNYGQCLATAASPQHNIIRVDETELSHKVTAMIKDKELIQGPSNIRPIPTNEEVDLWYAQATAAATKLDMDQGSSAKVHHLRADIATSTKQLSEAKKYYDKAKSGYVTSGQQLQLAEVNQSKAKVHRQSEEYDEALICLQEAEKTLKDLFRHQKTQIRVANTLDLRVEILHILSKPDDANKLQEESDKLKMKYDEAVAEDIKDINGQITNDQETAMTDDEQTAAANDVTTASNNDKETASINEYRDSTSGETALEPETVVMTVPAPTARDTVLEHTSSNSDVKETAPASNTGIHGKKFTAAKDIDPVTVANDDLVAEVTDDVKTSSIDDQQTASTNEDIDSITFRETAIISTCSQTQEIAEKTEHITAHTATISTCGQTREIAEKTEQTVHHTATGTCSQTQEIAEKTDPITLHTATVDACSHSLGVVEKTEQRLYPRTIKSTCSQTLETTVENEPITPHTAIIGICSQSAEIAEKTEQIVNHPATIGTCSQTPEIAENTEPITPHTGCEKNEYDTLDHLFHDKPFNKKVGLSPAPKSKPNPAAAAPVSEGPMSGFAAFSSTGTDFSSLCGATSNAFKKTDGFKWSGAGAPLFGGGSPGGANQNKENPEAYEVSADFKPVLDVLPDLIDVKTGEEDEEKIFCHRAKLFRFDGATKQWKERGIGGMKLLKHHANGTVRVLLRREQVHKLVCNHLVMPDMEIKPMATSETAWCWFAKDYSDNEKLSDTAEQFAVRFKNIALAQEFKDRFEESKEFVLKSINKKNNLKDLNASESNQSVTVNAESDDSVEEEDENSEEDEEADGADDDYEDDSDDSDDEPYRMVFERQVMLYEKQGDKYSKIGVRQLQIMEENMDILGGFAVYIMKGEEVEYRQLIFQETTQPTYWGSTCAWQMYNFQTERPHLTHFQAQFASTDASAEFARHITDGIAYAKELRLQEVEAIRAAMTTNPTELDFSQSASNYNQNNTAV